MNLVLSHKIFYIAVYEKVTDIFATSFDYNPNAEITIEFFK